MKVSYTMRYAPLCISLCLIYTQAVSQSAEEKTIKDLRQRSNQAIQKHDTASLALYWLDDVHVLTSRSVSLAGKQANQRAFQQEFQNKGNVVYVRTPTTIELFPNWDMAAEYGKWVGTWTSNGSAIRVGGSYYAKWHKVYGDWKIKSETYTPSSCEGGDYCKAFSFQTDNEAIVVQNFYFPKPGNEKEVLETRQRATRVRAQLGLPAGRILLRVSESTSQPYIIWECEYPSVKAREDDVASLDHSTEFKEVQDHMSGLLEKFDRAMWRVVK